jgi:hypothetical protein
MSVTAAGTASVTDNPEAGEQCLFDNPSPSFPPNRLAGHETVGNDEDASFGKHRVHVRDGLSDFDIAHRTSSCNAPGRVLGVLTGVLAVVVSNHD